MLHVFRFRPYVRTMYTPLRSESAHYTLHTALMAGDYCVPVDNTIGTLHRVDTETSRKPERHLSFRLPYYLEYYMLRSY
jgi:hypothetical protein